jgi:hypothetical protein
MISYYHTSRHEHYWNGYARIKTSIVQKDLMSITVVKDGSPLNKTKQSGIIHFSAGQVSI